jgi:hypothetical protein
MDWAARIGRYSRFSDALLAITMPSTASTAPRAAATPQQIAEAEQLMGVRLHKQYRDFLLHANGWPYFSGAISLLGTEDYMGSPMYQRALANIEALRQPVGYLSRSKSLLPIGVSDAALDTLCMPIARGGARATVIWYNNVEPEEFLDFETFFNTLLERMPYKIAYYKAKTAENDA